MTNLSLLIVGGVLGIMSVWMAVEAVGAFVRARRRRTARPQPVFVEQFIDPGK